MRRVPPLTQAVPAQPRECRDRQTGKGEELGGVSKLAEAGQERRHPPVDAAIAVAEEPVEPDRRGIVLVEGAEFLESAWSARQFGPLRVAAAVALHGLVILGLERRRFGGLREHPGRPDRAREFAQAPHQADHQDHREPDPPWRSPPQAQRPIASVKIRHPR